jgi:predicted enzyme related to lactoylglutathione lyase
VELTPPTERDRVKETTMDQPPFNTLAWFEVAAADVDGAERFYGGLFDWTFAVPPDLAAGGMDYRVTTSPATGEPMGGVVAAPDGEPSHAVFYVLVADVGATAAAAERLGGSVMAKETAPPAGPAFAMLRDPAGNLFGVFTPPAA